MNKHSNIEELKLRFGNEIDTQSFVLITESLEKNKRLKKIELGLYECHEIEAEGYLSLGKALNKHSNIEELKLDLA